MKPIIYKGYSIVWDNYYSAYICNIDNSRHESVIAAFKWIDYLTK